MDGMLPLPKHTSTGLEVPKVTEDMFGKRSVLPMSLLLTHVRKSQPFLNVPQYPFYTDTCYGAVTTSTAVTEADPSVMFTQTVRRKSGTADPHQMKGAK